MNVRIRSIRYAARLTSDQSRGAATIPSAAKWAGRAPPAYATSTARKTVRVAVE